MTTKMKQTMCLLLALLMLVGVMLVGCDEIAAPNDPTDETAPSDGNETPSTSDKPAEEDVPDSLKTTYDAALSCLKQGEIEEAYALFWSIPEYRDVSEHLERFVYRYGREVYHTSIGSSNLVEYQYNQYGQQTERIYKSSVLRRSYDDKGNLLREYFSGGDERYYTYDAKGNIVKMEYYSAHYGQVTSCDTYSYDEHGYLIERCYYYDLNTLFCRYIYAYDEAGNRMEMVVFYGDSEGYRYEFTYDEAGNQISMKYTDGDYWGLTEYEYNAKNQMTRETRTSSNGYDYEYRMEYDGHGNITRREEDYGINTELTVYEYTNEYDDKGRLIKITTMLDSEISSIRTYEYDENGNVMRDTRHEYFSGVVDYYNITYYLDYQLYYDPFIGRADPLADIDFGGK